MPQKIILLSAAAFRGIVPCVAHFYCRISMSIRILIFSCLFFINSYCFSQTKYKYEYKFSLPTQSHVILKDTSYWKDSLPEIYVIKSTSELSEKKIQEIKACVEQNRKAYNKCGIKNVVFISVEI